MSSRSRLETLPAEASLLGSIFLPVRRPPDRSLTLHLHVSTGHLHGLLVHL